MKALFAALCIGFLVYVTGPISSSLDDPILPGPVPCQLDWIIYDWDFQLGDCGFTPLDGAGQAVWEYGATGLIPDAPAFVWGTVLEGAYPSNSGHSIISPVFTVSEETTLVEVVHYYDLQGTSAGCNIKVNGAILPPYSGYDGEIGSNCTQVGGESGFTGSGGWRTDCFELSSFWNQAIALRFDFGSDVSMSSCPGWYLATVRIGGMTPTFKEETTWTRIKSLFY